MMKLKKKFKLANEVLFHLINNHSNIDPRKPKIHKIYDANIFAETYLYEVWMSTSICHTAIVEAMCHEFVHILQHHEGRLKNFTHGVEFEGVYYPNCSYTYLDCPWEVEAYTRERDFYLALPKQFVDIPVGL